MLRLEMLMPSMYLEHFPSIIQ